MGNTAFYLNQNFPNEHETGLPGAVLPMECLYTKECHRHVQSPSSPLCKTGLHGTHYLQVL